MERGWSSSDDGDKFRSCQSNGNPKSHPDMIMRSSHQCQGIDSSVPAVRLHMSCSNVEILCLHESPMKKSEFRYEASMTRQIFHSGGGPFEPFALVLANGIECSAATANHPCCCDTH